MKRSFEDVSLIAVGSLVGLGLIATMVLLITGATL